MDEQQKNLRPDIHDHPPAPYIHPPQTLDYGRPPKHYPPTDQKFPATGEFIAAFLASMLVSFLVFASMPRYTEGFAFLTIWVLSLVPIVALGVWARVKKQRPSWLSGTIAGIVLSSGLCGLLWSICGNPFRPFL